MYTFDGAWFILYYFDPSGRFRVNYHRCDGDEFDIINFPMLRFEQMPVASITLGQSLAIHLSELRLEQVL